MYQALYRKYRPTTFEEVIGQDVITRTLTNEILKNKISHAYLFTGPRGTGKTTIAKIFAKIVNCENLVNGAPCNKCVSCTQINDKQSTDIVEIDAASNNGVDEIREIRNKVNLVPSFSKYKVYIIDEVHMLTVGAFNALLKTLEEPPAHIIFILATTEPYKIPSTILSRCQRFDFKKISPNKIFNRLKTISEREKIKVDDDSLIEISRLSDGGMRDAISMLDQALAYSENSITIDEIHEVNGTLSYYEINDFLVRIFKKDILSVLKSIDSYIDRGKNVIKLTEELILILRNILLFKTVKGYFENEPEKIELYEKFDNIINKEAVIELIDLLNENIIKLRQSNDPKIILELLIIKFMSLSVQKKEIVESSNILFKQESNQVTESQTKKDKNQKSDKGISEKEIIDEQKINSITLKEEIHIENNKIEELKQLRINNTLARFDKKNFLKIKETLENIKDMLLVPDYSEIVSMILDGTIKAASDKNIIFVYNTISSANYFNENLIMIEEILEKNYGFHYKVIGVDSSSWEIIKKEFNNKNKKYIYQEENVDIKNILNQKQEETNEINSLFGEIVEIIN